MSEEVEREERRKRNRIGKVQKVMKVCVGGHQQSINRKYLELVF